MTDTDGNMAALNKYEHSVDKTEQAQQYVLDECEYLRIAAIAAIEAYKIQMAYLSDKAGLSEDWYDITDELEIR